MLNWISQRIENASWTRLVVFFGGLAAYSVWVFRPDGRYLQAKASAGTLPEEMFGFKDGEPERAISQLFGLEGDYMLFQALDIPFAVLNFFFLSAVFALALKKFRLGATPLRFIMLLPAIYLVTEFVENVSLVILTSGDGEPAALATFQQAVTTLKFAVGFPATGMAFFLLFLLGLSLLVTSFSKILKRN